MLATFCAHRLGELDKIAYTFLKCLPLTYLFVYNNDMSNQVEAGNCGVRVRCDATVFIYLFQRHNANYNGYS